jgi:malonyl-CoA O-methyltransferase
MANDEYWLAPALVRARFDAASASYDRAAGAVDELRARLLERLDLVKLNPQRVLDLGAGTGKGTRALKDRYAKAQVLALDSSFGMSTQARTRRGWFRRFEIAAGDAAALPLKNAAFDLVFSHLLLPWCNSLDAVFAEVARILRPGGLFLFSSLGPDTGRELRRLWRELDPAVHVHAFIDMHDVGDALLRNAFADPVMDVEQLTVTYPSFDALVREARELGVTNVAAGRPQGLGSKRKLLALREAYDKVRGAMEPLPVTLELVYGHAWRSTAARRDASGEVRVPLTQIARRRPG